MPPQSSRSPPGPSPLGEPLFRRYFLASCQSTMATWVTRFLLGWSAWELTHAAVWVGMVSALMLLPTLLLSPLFGVLSDRFSPRNGLLCTLLLQSLIAFAAAVASWAGWFSIHWLLALSCAVGAVTAAHQPMRLALIPRLVSRSALPAAIGISAILFNLSRVLGPALAGWMLVQWDVASAFAASGLLFAGALLTLLAVRGIGSAVAAKGTIVEQLWAGFALVRGDAHIRLILLLTLINGALGRTVIELLPALSGKLLNGDAGTLATLTAVAGTGAILAGLTLTRLRDSQENLLRMVIVCQIATALLLLSGYWIDSVRALALVVLGLAGAAHKTTELGVSKWRRRSKVTLT